MDVVLWVLRKENILSTRLSDVFAFKTIFCAASACIFGCKRSVAVWQTSSLDI